MVPAEHETSTTELERRGASARAAQLGYFDNPFYSSSKTPAATGESVEEWGRKADAWTRGWEIEDAIRASR